MSAQPKEHYQLEASSFRARTPAEVFSCRFGAKAGWAYIFLHEETGTVAIHSDYGDWIFSWPSPGRGPKTLKEFICSGSYDYMAGKFMMGRKDEVFDQEATKKAILDHYKELKKNGDISPGTFKDIRLELAEYNEDNVVLFWRDLPDEVAKRIEDPGAVFKYHPSHEFLWLREGVLPALITEIRKTMPAWCSCCGRYTRAQGSDYCEACIRDAKKVTA